MGRQRIYLDDQGGQVMKVLKEDISPTIMQNAGKAHALIVCEDKHMVKAFAQNTREEVRDLGDVAGCISAESGSHQTTYVCVRQGCKKITYGINAKQSEGTPFYEELSGCLSVTHENGVLIKKKGRKPMMSANPKSFGIGCDTEVSCTLLEPLFKDPPVVFRKD